jgi:hypothetical protein
VGGIWVGRREIGSDELPVGEPVGQLLVSIALSTVELLELCLESGSQSINGRHDGKGMDERRPW